MGKKSNGTVTGEPNLDALDIMPHALKRFRIRVSRLSRDAARQAIWEAVQHTRFYPGFKMERQSDGRYRARIRKGDLDFIAIFAVEPDGRSHIVTIIESPTVRWVPTKEQFTVPDILQLVEDYEGKLLDFEDLVYDLEHSLETSRQETRDWESYALYLENQLSPTNASYSPADPPPG